MKNYILLFSFLLISSCSHMSKVEMMNKSRIYFKPFDSNVVYNDDYTKEIVSRSSYFYSENKSIDELKWEIFSSLHGLRDVNLYNNISKIQDHFREKYDKCFFGNHNICKSGNTIHLFNKNGINYSDFIEVILPNINIEFFQEYSSTPPNFNCNYHVVYNWEFFKDTNDFAHPNACYTFEHSMGLVTRELNSFPDVICKVLEYLFSFSLYRPDAIMNGLMISKNDLSNSALKKYFVLRNASYGMERFNYLQPIKAGWDCNKIDNHVENDFKEILNYFDDNNLALCEILSNE